MKRQFWNLHFGKNKIRNKGFIFSLDAAIAIVVVMALLIVSTFYVTKAGSESVANLQMIRTGSDILTLLDNNKLLGKLFVSYYNNMGMVLDDIEIGLNEVLPTNYHMRIKVKCKDEGTLAIETTGEDPVDKFVGRGKRVFANNEGEACIAEYNIWLK